MRRTLPILTVLAFIVVVAGPASSPLIAQSDGSDTSRELITEFCRRAAKVAPLDAGSHYELAYWCSQNRLSKHAKTYLTRTIAIDSDHAAARKALGYERHGSGWVLSAAKAARRKSEGNGYGEGDGEDEGTGEPDVVIIEPHNADEATTDNRPGVPPPGDGTATAPGDSEAMAEDTTLTEVDAGVFAQLLEEKKEWAQLVAERMQHELQTYEDPDFLIHTTLPSIRHQKVTQLRHHLKAAKQLIEQTLGLKGSKVPLWPAKVQFLVMRSDTQYEQFAELIDDEQYANRNDGAYTKEGHTVLFNPASFLVVRRLALDAMETLHGAQKQYSWWINEGVAERLVAVTKMSRGTSDREKQSFYRNYKYVADIAKSGKDELSIYDLLESRELKRRDTEGGRSKAMTLVDFLSRSRRKGFTTLLTDLKGPDAPLVPDEEDDDGWKTYWLNYFAFQEKTLEVIFKKNTDELDLLWKRHVVETASKYSGSSDTANEALRRLRGRNR